LLKPITVFPSDRRCEDAEQQESSCGSFHG
jgi:hypothetical protein